jgi:hypothetical protein
MQNKNKIRAVVRTAIFAGVIVCAIAASSVFAATQVGPGAPKSPNAPATDKPPTTGTTAKPLKFSGIVVTANVGAIQVRDPKNPAHPMSFSYSPAVRDQMVKILTAGGFQYGDKVTITYATGTTVALKLQGKPSKPKKQQPPPQTTQ